MIRFSKINPIRLGRAIRALLISANNQIASRQASAFGRSTTPAPTTYPKKEMGGF